MFVSKRPERYHVFVTSTDVMFDIDDPAGFTNRPGISQTVFSSNTLLTAKTAAYCWAKFLPVTKGQPRGEARVIDMRSGSARVVAKYP